MAVSRKTVMAFTSYQNLAIKSYQNQAHVLVKNYLLADPFIPYTSILGGIFLFKVIHHSLSGVAVAYSMFSGEGQLYTFMILISEVSTPAINMRWYLDTAGMKRSSAYLINGIVIFFAWLAARILLFVYMFYHVYLHYDQVIQMHAFGYFLVFVVPSALAIMNLMWFGKIIMGLKKTLAKRQ